MKRALVTGAAGFVGRHLIPKLKDAGYAITSIDPRLNMTFEEYLLKSLGKWIDVRFDLVVHLAANIVNINDRMQRGIEQYEDIELDYKMALFVEETKPKCFIAMSSCAVDNPVDPYCIVKRNLEAMAITLSKNQNVKILRPFSGYGFDQTQEYPFPAILGRAYRQENPLTVWGGNQERDWIHIEDLTDGIMHSIDNFPSGEPVELGTGEGTSFFRLALLMADTIGYVPTIYGDKTKATSSAKRIAGLVYKTETGIPVHQGKEFGWYPKISLEEGIAMELTKLINKH